MRSGLGYKPTCKRPSPPELRAPRAGKGAQSTDKPAVQAAVSEVIATLVAILATLAAPFALFDRTGGIHGLS